MIQTTTINPHHLHPPIAIQPILSGIHLTNSGNNYEKNIMRSPTNHPLAPQVQ